MRKNITMLIALFLCLAGVVQAQPPMPTGITGLESYALPGYFLTCRNNTDSLRLIAGGDQTTRGQWTIVTGLFGTGNVSFIPVAYASENRYLRHRNYVIYVETGTDDLFKQDASWKPVPGLADPTNPRLVSFESVNFPGYYLNHDALSGSISVRNSTVTATATADAKARATWMFPDKSLPSRPRPTSKSTENSIDVGGISWKPGEGATSHTVFFGTDADSVTNATTANPLGTTVYQGLDVNNIPMGRLAYDATYYWKVVESPTGALGDVWSFKMELQGYPLVPANIIDVTTAGTSVYPEQEPNSTVNKKGLDANDVHSTLPDGMWIGMGDAPGTVWIQYEFDKVYMLHDMLVWNYNEESPGEMFGAKDVNIAYSLDGNDWKAMPTVTLNSAPGDNTCKANSTVEFNGAIARFVRITFLTSYADMDIYGLSEVRFSAEPTRAGGASVTLSPANNATNQGINVPMTWKPGRYAAEHYVYISTDINDVNGVPLVASNIVTEPNFIPALDINKRYYWRVDEVNMANAYTTWDGIVRTLTTTSSLIIDGFATSFYGATEVNYVWATWKDGQDVPANGGSVIGLNTAPPGLSTTNHSGGNSMQVNYDNSGANALSQVTAQSVKLPIGRTDWTVGDPDALVVWFRGDPNNPVTDELYLKLNNTEKVYDGFADDIKRTAWTRWEIPLAGINLSNISSLTIGIRKTGATGGKGVLYIDDIQLTITSPAPADPGLSGLVAKYDMENNVLDSSGSGYNGAAKGTIPVTYQAGKKGQALVLTGVTADAQYIELPIGNLISTLESCTISFWVNWAGSSQTWNRVFDFGSGSTDNLWFTPRASSTVMRLAIKAANGGEDQANASPRLSTGNWEYITCVVDAENMDLILYLNGIEVARDSSLQYLPKDMGVTTQNWLGRSQYSSDPYFGGMLDDFRIYNRALSAGEVKYLYKN